MRNGDNSEQHELNEESIKISRQLEVTKKTLYIIPLIFSEKFKFTSLFQIERIGINKKQKKLIQEEVKNIQRKQKKQSLGEDTQDSFLWLVVLLMVVMFTIGQTDIDFLDDTQLFLVKLGIQAAVVGLSLLHVIR